MTHELTRRDTLGLGLTAAFWPRPAHARRPRLADQGGGCSRARLPDREGAPCACSGPCVRAAGRGCLRANAKRFTEKSGVEVKVDFVGWRTLPAARGDREFRRRARHHHRLHRRAAHLCREDHRAERPRRLSRQALRRLDVPRREIRQAPQEQQLDRIAVRLGQRPAGLSQIAGAGGGVRARAGRPRELSEALPEAEGSR